jgi:ankyrin repeat protein
LLIKGANVDVETVEGWTPLMMAIKTQNKTILQILLKHPGIKVNQVTKQGTVLCMAVEADLIDFAEILLTNKAN